MDRPQLFLQSQLDKLGDGDGSDGGGGIIINEGTLPYVTDLGAVTAGVPVIITHGLNNLDVIVSVIKKTEALAGPASGEIVWATINTATLDTVTLTFAENAPANTYRVIVSEGAGSTVIMEGGTGGGLDIRIQEEEPTENLVEGTVWLQPPA